MRLRGIAFGWIIVLALGAVARAQTGGSMGGDDFGNSSSDTPSSTSSSSSSSDYSSSYTPSYDYSGTSNSGGGSSGGSGSGSGGAPALVVFFFFGVVVIGVMVAPKFVSIHHTAPMPRADVTVLRIGIDARARKLVQSELARIAQTAQTGTSDGRAAMLREIALMLRRLRDGWVYGGADNEAFAPKAVAEMTYRRHIDEARVAFKDELVRNEQGVTTTRTAAAPLATSDDGPGIMLVSIIVAARHELFTVGAIGDGEELRKALESLSSMIASELIGVEIVWMPAAEDERLSSIALETRYPQPRLFPIDGALVGKVFCQYCGSPYPAEGVCCPNCGGRASAHA